MSRMSLGFRTSSTVIQVGEENSLVTRVVDPYFTQYWNRLDFLCLLSSGKTVLTILDLEKMTSRIPLSDLSSLSHLAIPVCVYAKTRDLILLRSCYADAGETELASINTSSSSRHVCIDVYRFRSWRLIWPQ